MSTTVKSELEVETKSKMEPRNIMTKLEMEDEIGEDTKGCSESHFSI